ncbi:MAG: sensor histidine kinase [Oxalobacteraceae bacterium]|nr:MAG: sensor histidine kinase [Oxalobacteraceae bacterium]
MPNKVASIRPIDRHAVGSSDLLLQETIHRAGNDLQMIVGLLALQSRSAKSAETRQALADVMERVGVLARARRELSSGHRPSLATALEHVCTALQSQAGPRSILITLQVDREAGDLSSSQIMTLALVVNELATNAIKHAYEDGKSGYIAVTQSVDPSSGTIILVDDDGLPFPDAKNPDRGGLGLEIARRLMSSIGGLLIPPKSGSKVFELRMPAAKV